MELSRNLFICIIGMDGSGKTTLAIALQKSLQKSISCRYVHSLIDTRIMKPFEKIGRKIVRHKSSNASEYKTFRQKKQSLFSKYPLLAYAYKFLQAVDYAPQLLWKIWLPVHRGKNIISDRYIYDTIIYMGLNFDYGVDRICRDLDIWFRVFPKPDITFLIDIDEHIALSRKADVPSIDYLKERRGVYLGLASKLGFTVLDGSKSIDELCKYIEGRIITHE